MTHSEQESRLLVLAFDETSETDEIDRAVSRFDETAILDFSNGSRSDVDVPASTQYIDYSDYASEAYVGNADAYVDFVEGIGDATAFGTRLSDAFVYRNASVWRILAHRFKGKSQTYDHLVNDVGRINITRRVVDDNEFTHALVLGATDRRHVVVGEMLSDAGLSVLNPKDPPQFRWTLSALAILAFGFVRFFFECFLVALSKVVEHQYMDGVEVPNADLFYTASKHWFQYDWEMNRYFHDLPEYVTDNTELHHAHLVALSTGPIRKLPASIRELVTLGKSGEPVGLMRAAIRPRDVWSAFAVHVRTTVYATWLLVAAPDDRFTFDGVNYRWLMVGGFADRVASVPFHLLAYHGVSRRVNETEPSVFTTTHFEGPLGQVAIWGVNERGSVPVLGVQHGPVTPGKLQYYASVPPTDSDLPTRIAVDGSFAEEFLVDQGIPAGRVMKTGGVRYDQLCRAVEETETTESAGVTVFFSLSDYEWMANVVLPVLADRDVEQIRLKPHPSAHQSTATVIDAVAADCGLQSYEVVDTDAHALIAASDLVVASYSSTAVETVAMGTRLVCVIPRNRVDATPFRDEDPIPKAGNQAEFRAAFESVEKIDQSAVDEFLTGFFYSLDGNAKRRVAEATEEVSVATPETEPRGADQ